MTLPKLDLTSTSTATTYRFKADVRCGWACCTVNDATSELSITSDWGNWAHRWNIQHLGSPSLTAFLSEGSFDYLADKLTTREEREIFDADATLEACREQLREARREWKNGGETTWSLRNMRLRNEGRWWEVDDDALDKEAANRLWDEDLPRLCRDAESRSHGAGDAFVEGFFRLSGGKRVTEEPWNLIRHRPSGAYHILKDAILPALAAACAAEHERRTAPRVRECTCLGSCKGASALAPGWQCALAKKTA